MKHFTLILLRYVSWRPIGWSLLGIVIISGLALAWFIAQKHEAVRQIRHVGGSVQFETFAPDWVDKLTGGMGTIGFGRVSSAYLCNSDVSDPDIAALRELNGVYDVALNDTRITDAGMIHLSEIVAIQVLDLSDTAIGDDGVRQLSRLTNMRRLSLCNTMVTNKCMAYLSGMTRMMSLQMDRTGVTDHAMKVIATHMSELQVLSLKDTHVGDAGIADLLNMGTLEELDVRGTDVSRAAVIRSRTIRPALALHSDF